MANQAVINHHDKSTAAQGQEPCNTSIRCMEPYQVSESIWLTPVWPSDASELFRILNINEHISEGLYSISMRFPFPEDAAISFTKRHQEKRIAAGAVTSWAIRTSVDGPMIGLFAMDPFDHGDEMGPCYSNVEQKYNSTQELDSMVTEARQAQILSCGGLGYWISPEHVGKGIMSQVVSYGLKHLARKEFGYDRVHGEAWIENRASQRVMEHAGMYRTVGVPCFVPKFNVTKDIAHYIFDTWE
ncbi:hypothetical protein BGX27_004792 [Mortierella sp. AM989]|nr:hypothetical protein BGX27_004792 [Mortierella sp. AM989]